MQNSKISIQDICSIAIMTAITVVLAQISIPMPLGVPMAMQTFAVTLAGIVLGAKRGAISMIIYVLLGAIGVPVFAGFTGGFGIIMNNTGGYIVGFIFTALAMWLMESLFGRKLWVQAISMILGLFICYAFGTVWFMLVYMRNTGAVGLMTVLGWCVIPFIIPDAIKIVLALVLSNTLKKPLASIIGEAQHHLGAKD